MNIEVRRRSVSVKFDTKRLLITPPTAPVSFGTLADYENVKPSEAVLKRRFPPSLYVAPITCF